MIMCCRAVGGATMAHIEEAALDETKKSTSSKRKQMINVDKSVPQIS
jgi:hypothetical protein